MWGPRRSRGSGWAPASQTEGSSPQTAGPRTAPPRSLHLPLPAPGGARVRGAADPGHRLPGARSGLRSRGRQVAFPLPPPPCPPATRSVRSAPSEASPLPELLGVLQPARRPRITRALLPKNSPAAGQTKVSKRFSRFLHRRYKMLSLLLAPAVKLNTASRTSA